MRNGGLLPRIAAGAVSCLVVQLWGPQAHAEDLAYEASLGVGRSDNILRNPSNEKSEDIASAGLQFSFDKQSSKLQADAVADLAYFDYRDDTFDSQLVGNFAGNALFAIVPERFQWVASDNFGQVLSDPFQPATPDNDENLNYFTTGPDVTFGLGSQTRLRLGGRYSLTSYEKSPFDSDSLAGQLGLIHLLSGSSSISLNGRVEQVNYKEAALNADYDQDDGYVRYEAQGARTKLGLDAGYSRIKQDAATDSQGGLLFRLDVSRRISGSSVVVLTGGREFATSGSAFAASQGASGVSLNAAPGRQTVQPFTNDYATLAWNFSRNRTGLSLFGSWNDQSYDDFPALDQTITRLGAQVRRELSQATSLTINANRASASFQQGADYDDDIAGVELTWHLSRTLVLGLSYNYFHRNSDLATADYTENRYWLRIGYARGTPRSGYVLPTFAIDTATTGT
jgi:putative beta-barrel porin BBP2